MFTAKRMDRYKAVLMQNPLHPPWPSFEDQAKRVTWKGEPVVALFNVAFSDDQLKHQAALHHVQLNWTL